MVYACGAAIDFPDAMGRQVRYVFWYHALHDPSIISNVGLTNQLRHGF